jgi:Transmembrane domain of unknown function (DUF3566)
MKAVVSTAETGARSEEARLAPRQTKVVVRRVHPWSVFKFSLLFYFCVMLVILLGLTILYNVLAAVGVLDSASKLLGDLGFGKNFEFHGWWLLSRAFAVGVVMVVFWSLVKLLITFMYNLISDLVGGIEVTLTERR